MGSSKALAVVRDSQSKRSAVALNLNDVTRTVVRSWVAKQSESIESRASHSSLVR